MLRGFVLFRRNVYEVKVINKAIFPFYHSDRRARE